MASSLILCLLKGSKFWLQAAAAEQAASTNVALSQTSIFQHVAQLKEYVARLRTPFMQFAGGPTRKQSLCCCQFCAANSGLACLGVAAASPDLAWLGSADLIHTLLYVHGLPDVRSCLQAKARLSRTCCRTPLPLTRLSLWWPLQVHPAGEPGSLWCSHNCGQHLCCWAADWQQTCRYSRLTKAAPLQRSKWWQPSPQRQYV